MATNIMVFTDEADKARIRDVCNAYFQRFLSQRKDIDEAYDVSDWMYKCGTSRGEYDEERRQWVPRYVPSKSNVGSTLAHRQVNTLAGMLGSILFSGRDLWRYVDKPVRGNPEAGETGAMTADQMNAMAAWIRKADGFDVKLPEFCISVFKDSNIFAHIAMKREEREVWEAEMVAEADGVDPSTGEPRIKFKKKMKRRKGVVYEYPTVTFPYPRNVYADKYIKDIASQECVIILSQTTLAKLMAERKWLDKEALAKIDPEKMMWDGVYGGEGQKAEQEHAGRRADTATGVLLRWDAYVWLPVQNGHVLDLSNRDDASRREPFEMRLYWCVFVGNSIADSVLLKCTDEFDPDGEIPLVPIRASPDGADMLYHTFLLGEVVRPMYAADCAAMNAAIDHDALANDPPRTVLIGQHRIKDFTMKPGQLWQVQSHDAVRRWDVGQTQLATLALRDQIRQDIKLALATDDSRIGEYAGARTSATEVLRVTAATDATIALRNAYILGQLLPWIARKYVSYCREFMSPEVRQRILNEMMFPDAKGEYIGDYDIVVDIIGQYDDEMMRQVSIDRLLQIIASNPAMLNSPTHTVDIRELLRMAFDAHKLPGDRIIKPPNTADSESNARQRIQTMLLTGVYIPPRPGENIDIHMSVVRAEILRWRALDPKYDRRAENVPLLERYLRDLEMLAQSTPSYGMNPAAGGPRDIRVETPGQVVGNARAAELGAIMGGAV